nr:hypothetical protein [Actinomycetota bacterium]
MADSVESESRPPSRRRRRQNRNRDDGTGLSVAELLARHAAPEIASPEIAAPATATDEGTSPEIASPDDGGLPTPRRVHRRTPAPVDQTDQFVLGGAGLGHASTDQYLLDALFGSLADMPATSSRSAAAPGSAATPAAPG